jgi:predicted transcriptional regulator YdeE
MNELEIDHSPLVSRRLPAHLCAGFIHKDSAGRLPLTMDYIYHTWLPRSNRSLALPLAVERFGDPFCDSPDSEREIWIPIN